ncbi:acyl-CoA dehydrogenase [Cryobacterium zhongshanensis]|uniref:Acyl-CoA dehydrogenase n=1 Tax=Cryobacterium zhongshanensis TaxID=2928153 RepID=A0AA41QUK1_9MICO|nr:acyl-CoA dehydrogenase [Cryobacterium zhongshanensis]MCI4657252.1 acyl-CoA dehydrogenase [Cryobacterium zhongshanensis]
MSESDTEITSGPVRLDRSQLGAGDDDLRVVADRAFQVNGNTQAALRLAVSLGVRLDGAGPGSGRTERLFDTLATVAAADLTAARVVEAHLDALSILEQAADSGAGHHVESGDGRTWGVFAAEGRGTRLEARQTESGWRLDGVKPWCSLAGSLSHALVTAHTSETTRRLFVVDLRVPGITVSDGTWVARGLAALPSGPVDFRGVPAEPIGVDGWYLDRPGFAWGGIGVAACWWGGAVGVARRVYRDAEERTPDQIGLAHLGAIDILLTASGQALAAAATSIDDGTATGTRGAVRAARVRGLVAGTAESVIERAGHALGPSPLAFDSRHAQRVADLQLYIRQHHAERDEARLGVLLLDGARANAPW